MDNEHIIDRLALSFVKAVTRDATAQSDTLDDETLAEAREIAKYVMDDVVWAAGLVAGWQKAETANALQEARDEGYDMGWGDHESEIFRTAMHQDYMGEAEAQQVIAGG